MYFEQKPFNANEFKVEMDDLKMYSEQTDIQTITTEMCLQGAHSKTRHFHLRAL